MGGSSPGSARKERSSLEQVALDLSGNGGLERLAACNEFYIKMVRGELHKGCSHLQTLL